MVRQKSSPKRLISAQEQATLRAILQTATIDALMASRRWEPGDIAFQGGTSLHLVHGSARFSEDLDFMVRAGLSLAGLAREVQQRLRLPASIPTDLGLTVTTAKDDKNPHSFYVTLGGPDIMGSAKVKIELWQTPAASLQSLRIQVSTVRSEAGMTFVPTLPLEEIMADKVYALGARNRIKARDLFDLDWLHQRQVPPATQRALLTRLAIYPVQGGQELATARHWMHSAQARLADLQRPTLPALVAQDLQRWLPTSWRMDSAVATALVQLGQTLLQQGIAAMQTIVQVLEQEVGQEANNATSH